MKKTLFVLFAVFFFGCVARNDMIEEPSASPTLMPSPIPKTVTPSSIPSVLSSVRPSDVAAPTIEPSFNFGTKTPNVPSNATQDPSQAPSLYASASPSLFASDVPSILPSYHPTPVPTPFPSVSPSILPTGSPTITIVRVSLPQMIFEFSVVSGEIDNAAFKADITEFLNDSVESNAKILGNFSHVELDVTVASTTYRRLIQGRVTAIVEGNAYFVGDEYPTKARLKEVLRTYFSNWGGVDLKDYLTTDDIRVDDVQVTMEGELIGDARYVPGSNTQPQNNGGKNSPPLGVVIALAAGCLVLVLAVAMLLIWRKKPAPAKPEEAPTPASSPSRSLVQKPKPMVIPTDDQSEISAMITNDDGEFSIDGISFDESIFNTAKTLETNDVYIPRSLLGDVEQYDTKRLDKVISTAHDHAQDHISMGTSVKSVGAIDDDHSLAASSYAT